MAVHPLGGAGVHYWSLIAERYKLDLTVLDAQVDPQFSFMCADWDGQIRMDPSSVYAMQVLIKQKDHYTVSFACDTDHDRHGIVTPNAGLIPPNHYLTVAIDYLFNYRTEWSPKAAIGKTAVSSQIIDRLATELGREIYEVPVGFKWFVPGLESGNLGFAGEESAGVSFLRRNGKVWTTDKDGIIAALLSAEIIAHTGRDPAEIYQSLNQKLGHSFASRFQASANAKQRAQLANISAQKMQLTSLAQDPIVSISTHASGNNAALGGVKVVSAHGWFAVRPSGTEDIYKIYAESFKSPEHLGLIMAQAQTFIEAIFQE